MEGDKQNPEDMSSRSMALAFGMPSTATLPSTPMAIPSSASTWYDQKETPGLGANIAEAYWQSLFPSKKLFQEGADGKTDFKTAPLGITVVKGKVSEVLGDVTKGKERCRWDGRSHPYRQWCHRCL